jgi:hypothetical protein
MFLSLLRKADTENRKPGESSPTDYFVMGALVTTVGLVFGIVIATIVIFTIDPTSPTIVWSPSYLMILPMFSVLVSALVLSFTRLRQSPEAFLPAIIGSTIASIFMADLTTFKFLALTHTFPPFLPLFFIIIAAEEALFWIDGEKLPPGRSVISFTMQKKLEAFLDVGIGVLAYIYGAALAYLVINTNVLAQIGEFALVPIGMVILAVAFIYGNSLKYRRRE